MHIGCLSGVFMAKQGTMYALKRFFLQAGIESKRFYRSLRSLQNDKKGAQGVGASWSVAIGSFFKEKGKKCKGEKTTKK